MTAPPILELDGVTRRFGGLVAVNDVTMAVRPRTIHGVIGPNGAGKSTTFDLVSGLTTPSAGTIRLDGRDITGLSVEGRVAAGICRTFQTPRLFEDMTVLETAMTGRHLHGRMGVFGSMFAIRAKFRDEAAIMAEAWRVLDLVGLRDEADTLTGALSYGRRRLVEIARALASGPRILLLDEVASGLNPVETEAVGHLIRNLVAGGLTVVLVEHDMRFVMSVCEHITALNFGRVIADGTPREIAADEAVVEAYLGRPSATAVSRRDLRHGRRNELASAP
jgi:branched-chain amino acid transport system ATP-binding protein